MRTKRIGFYLAGAAIALAFVAACTSDPAAASPRHGASIHARSGAHARFATRSYGGGLQCVPFARENTGIELAGNAASWWSNAEGVYERGARPEVGSVLNFRANGRMRMGHVAVVSNVVDGRNIEIDHANWAGPGAGRGSVTRNITVVDVSPQNDWSAVRVALGHTGEFGSVYPTYGFIYDRPDKGVLVANTSTAPAPILNAAPRDLRPAAERMQVATVAQDSEEVAEASDDAQPRVRHVSARHGATVHGLALSNHAGRTAAASRQGTRAQVRVAATTPHAHHAPARHRA